MIRNRRNMPLLLLALAGAAIPAFADAHEYWVEPEQFTPATGTKLTAALRNGQDFKGSPYPYIKSQSVQFTLALDDESRDLGGRDGDFPALYQDPLGEGLHVVSYQNTFSTLRFAKWEKFTYYLEYEGLEALIPEHEKRGLPQTGFKEKYARCAKALIASGNAEGSDRLTGMQIEFVAEENPYLETDGDIIVRLYYEGKPLPNHPFNLFSSEGESIRTQHTTDAEGRARVPYTASGKFMLNSVYLYPGDDDVTNEEPEYYSYWASLVFGGTGTDAHFKALADTAKDATKAGN